MVLQRSPGLSRLASLDALRGAVMMIMALDHTRDFLHRGAMSFSATDLSKTTAVLFFTRWITHFCLPVFVFTAGTGVFLWLRRRGRTIHELSRFLLLRGIWFVSLELTVMQFAYDFNVPTRFLILLLVLWIFGLCMIGMALLVYIRTRWLAVLSVFAIVSHNCLDRIDASSFGSFAWVWRIVHQPGLLTVARTQVLVTYTVIPWLAVMAAGFCFGEILILEPQRRRQIIRNLGLLLVTLFLILRVINRYGDPAPWAYGKSPVFTMLSFLNCTKYPGSLDFLLMTLGPAMLALASLDRHPPGPNSPLVVFGRVPFFYFVLHLYVLHAVVLLLSFWRYGAAALAFVFHPVPSMGGSAQLFPKDFGWSLTSVYLIWIAVVAVLYPLCRWFAQVKSQRRSWWLSYL